MAENVGVPGIEKECQLGFFFSVTCLSSRTKFIYMIKLQVSGCQLLDFGHFKLQQMAAPKLTMVTPYLK